MLSFKVRLGLTVFLLALCGLGFLVNDGNRIAGFLAETCNKRGRNYDPFRLSHFIGKYLLGLAVSLFPLYFGQRAVFSWHTVAALILFLLLNIWAVWTDLSGKV